MLAVLSLLAAFAALPARADLVADPGVQAMVDAVTRTQLEPMVRELSGEAPMTVGGQTVAIASRSSYSGDDIDRVERYVYEHLEACGLDSVVYDEFLAEAGAPPGRNVIGQIEGGARADEIVILGAHLDDRPWEGRAPGADDDASGVAATLLLACAFAGHGFDRTVRFAFWGDEENAPWTCEQFGSAGYAAACAAAGEDIVAVVQADAMAFDPPESEAAVAEMNCRADRADPEGRDRAIATLWQDAIAAYGIGEIEPRVIAQGMNWSDHGSFWNAGYPAVMLSAEEWDYWNPNWHTTNDTAGTLAWPLYVQVTRSYLATAAHLASIEPETDDSDGDSDDDGDDGRPPAARDCACGGVGAGPWLPLTFLPVVLRRARRHMPLRTRGNHRRTDLGDEVL